MCVVVECVCVWVLSVSVLFVWLLVLVLSVLVGVLNASQIYKKKHGCALRL